MSSKPFVILLPAILLTLFLVYGFKAAAHDVDSADPETRRYAEATSYYNQLLSTTKLASLRQNWIKGARNFRQIYLLSPNSDTAPACLFMLGRIYRDMYDHFGNDEDLDESISYFKDTIRLFSRHRIADDAMFDLARIYLEPKKDPSKAAATFSEIINKYPHGDMYAKAEAQLKALSARQNIGTPAPRISSSDARNLSFVLPVKYWSKDDYSRVVIKASNPVHYTELLVKAPANASRRLYIDFKNSYVEPRYRTPVPISDGLLRKIQTVQLDPATVRVAIEMDSIQDYKIFNLPDPFRVVIDVHGKGKKTGSALRPILTEHGRKIKKSNITVKNGPTLVPDKKKIVFSEQKTQQHMGSKPALATTEPFSLAQQLGLGVKKIIIDPGHGGKDPGAMAFGMKEKDIVLAVAKKLAPLLKKELHCQVLLTRDKDVFIPLEERTAIANTENADLFVSLHINAHPSAKVRGVETYYLNLSTNAEAMRVAARENAISTHQMSDLQDILADILRNSKIKESARLAQQVHDSIYRAVKKSGYGDMNDLGVKQAPFYVLIGAEMPAILVEMAFISNKQDARNLQDHQFLNLLASEIAGGIRNYVNNTTAQLSFYQ